MNCEPLKSHFAKLNISKYIPIKKILAARQILESDGKVLLLFVFDWMEWSNRLVVRAKYSHFMGPMFKTTK